MKIQSRKSAGQLCDAREAGLVFGFDVHDFGMDSQSFRLFRFGVRYVI